MTGIGASPAAERHPLVVLGSGRSGTSLLMQALTAMGLRVSPQLIAARDDNPEGFFEDARIVRIQADLLRALDAWPFRPLPADWLTHPATHAAADSLSVLLRQHLAQPGAWGFKDPRTASFLPLWQNLFSTHALTPRYLLALRAPSSTLRSFMTAYAISAAEAERVWLQRTCDALWHTRAACYIVHYEDWFSRGQALAEELACYTGLPLPETWQQVPKPGLNRAAQAGVALQSEAARRLHATLQTCRGNAFDRAALLDVVADMNRRTTR